MAQHREHCLADNFDIPKGLFAPRKRRIQRAVYHLGDSTGGASGEDDVDTGNADLAASGLPPEEVYEPEEPPSDEVP